MIASDSPDDADTVPLLISVRSIAEARLACRFPLAIIDFKNPSAGALGRCDDGVLEQVSQLKTRGLGFSAACGELKELRWDDFQLPAGFQFAKAGPAGISSVSTMRDAMQQFRSALPDAVTSVAVAYADHVEAQCLPAETIADLAIESRTPWLLIDTASKDGRRLLDWISAARLKDLIGRCRVHGVRTVLAGSLALGDVAPLRALQPDLFGIRGAVCEAGRRTAIDPEKIDFWCRAFPSAAGLFDQ
ncbi:hypothetical protein Poly24_18490 [Rosistilla carotiformis]|uniref:(5-formylfuran-3-yl)methyl phosphate synthase n=1 Tax=Rosistilla carotiformis TaxID=2528017 RepID=A0A518JRH1_9BACT|nr:(5-formylfuran-3-yl)methyl phosphate synthase [Rosistilla carotiformis]QDV68141.1 hypothetical protein Poly24_18490 [Rosistilla carotiformis]